MTRAAMTIAMNGVTGRMGYSQHLVRSILAIRADGGLALTDGSVAWPEPEPVLVGRDLGKLEAIAERHGLDQYTTDLDQALDGDGRFFGRILSVRGEGPGRRRRGGIPRDPGSASPARAAHLRGSHAVLQDGRDLPRPAVGLPGSVRHLGGQQSGRSAAHPATLSRLAGEAGLFPGPGPGG